MFSSCVFMLVKRKTVQRGLLTASVVLFLLASADICLTLFFFFHFVLQSDQQTTNGAAPNHNGHEPWNRTLEFKFVLYVVANAIASGLLIHRCYTVWQIKRILIAPITLLICGTVISFVSISASQLGDRLLAASFITSAAANLSVTFLIGVRIWWTSRKVWELVRVDLSSINSILTSLILDSGAIYSLSIFLYLLFRTLVLDASLTQIAGVTVTAMILRNSHSCEVLGASTTLSGTTTQPDMQGGHGVVGETTYAFPRHRLRTSVVLTSRLLRSDTISVNSSPEFK
ncbi:hypothetical protein B0H34DRAFT_534300 [Crassisporium funariophilum]|nr:hypothetical protein B0H34DRAFT_534300 [Crassisporium funariophilum]